MSNSQQTSIKRDQKWIVAERRHDDLIEHLVRLRGIDHQSSFFDPQFPEDLHDPFLMKGMEVAVERIVEALQTGQVIGLFADYDADGSPGAAILGDGLRQLGARLAYYIPRRSEGYGLSEKGLQALAAAGARVVITIDLGVTGKALVELARNLGLDVIVADHHTIQPDTFPYAALAVLNPKQPDCPYPEKELCGAAIAWKLLCGILDYLTLKRPALLRGRNPDAIARWALDLAGIATLADLVPLRGENRTIAIYGLKVLAKTRRPGLRALYEVAGIDPARISASTVGFQIAPRLNAPTRLAAESYTGHHFGPHASLTLALLLSTDEAEARQLASILGQYNNQRQAQLESVLKAAEQQIVEMRLMDNKVMVVAGEDWPEGIVGLVAARLLEKYHRPTFVLSLSSELATGSARSIESFPLVENLAACRDLLISFGGHHKAAGLRLKRKNLDAFTVALNRQAERLTEADLAPTLHLDAELLPKDINLDLAIRIEKFAPYGVGNPRPTFFLSKLRVIDHRLIGKDGRHLAVRTRFTLGHQETLRLVGWNMAAERDHLPIGSLVDLAVQLERGEWNGVPQIDLKMVAHRPSQD